MTFLPFQSEDSKLLFCNAECECGQVNKLMGYNDYQFFKLNTLREFKCVFCGRKYAFRWTVKHIEIEQIL